jgi:LysM repeat protein
MLQVALAFLVIAAALLVYTPRNVSAECGVYHTVDTGQNLFRISLRYGVSLYSIAAANGITNVNLIYVGQRLYIPCVGSTTTGSNYILVSLTPSPTLLTSQFQVVGTPPATGLACTGFQGTSPDAFNNESATFYWDPPSDTQIARYQVRILNAQGANVGSYETLAPNTSLVGDTSPRALGDGTNFYWYVVGVTADNRICQTTTRYAQREWPAGDPPVATATP